MTSFLLALFRALIRPSGVGDGDLLSTRRKYHLLQAEWYVGLAGGEAAGRLPRPAAPRHAAGRAPACRHLRLVSSPTMHPSAPSPQ